MHKLKQRTVMCARALASIGSLKKELAEARAAKEQVPPRPHKLYTAAPRPLPPLQSQLTGIIAP